VHVARGTVFAVPPQSLNPAVHSCTTSVGEFGTVNRDLQSTSQKILSIVASCLQGQRYLGSINNVGGAKRQPSLPHQGQCLVMSTLNSDRCGLGKDRMRKVR